MSVERSCHDAADDHRSKTRISRLRSSWAATLTLHVLLTIQSRLRTFFLCLVSAQPSGRQTRIPIANAPITVATIAIGTGL